MYYCSVQGADGFSSFLFILALNNVDSAHLQGGVARISSDTEWRSKNVGRRAKPKTLNSRITNTNGTNALLFGGDTGRCSKTSHKKNGVIQAFHFPGVAFFFVN